MAPRFFVRAADNVIIATTEDDDLTAPTGATAVARSVIEAAHDGAIFQGGTWDGTTYTPPTGVVGTVASTRKRQLWGAYRTYNAEYRRGLWVSLQTSGANADRPIRALDRWVVQQVALGDLAADGNWPSGGDDDDIVRVVDKISDTITLIAETWYRVMVGDAAKAASWASAGVADGSPIYSDLFTTAGADRTVDGVFQPIAGATIPTSFSPEYPNLRTP